MTAVAMTPRFWDEPSGDDKSTYDPLYILNRDTRSREDVREFVESLWSRYAPFCGDLNFLGEARRHFAQFTWQMYMGVCLLEAGHTVEKAAPEGPDHKLLVSGRRVWVECIAPSAGKGDNRAERTIQSWTKTEAGGHGAVRPPPDEKIQARLTGALLNKARQHRRWVETGVISADDPYVIAIGGGIIPDTDLAIELPHIVRALFGLGEPVITYELYSDKEAELVPTYQHEIKRVAVTPGGETYTSISLRGFLDETLYPEVSAAIFCSEGVWNPPRKIGRDLITVYNAVAKRPLPPGTFPLGDEYWAEDVLHHRDNREELRDVELDAETKKILDELRAQDRERRRLRHRWMRDSYVRLGSSR